MLYKGQIGSEQVDAGVSRMRGVRSVFSIALRIKLVGK